MKVIGVREEKYIGTSVSGHNCDFTYEDAEMTRHVVLGILSDMKTKVEITLEDEEGECGSGWCPASWGNMKVEQVDNFKGFNYKPKKEIIIDDIEIKDYYDDYSNSVFTVSYDGGDSYYPSGSYSINLDFFTKTSRVLKKRPVYIFKGESAVGKSWLAGQFNEEIKVFETDSVSYLPESITANVIVFGNRNEYLEIDDIIECLTDDVEPIICDMIRYKK